MGTVAQQILLTPGTATVLGVTSRGIFLKTEPRWVIFLSYEDFRSPLTINLQGDFSPSSALTPGGLLQLTPGLITAPEHNLIISTQGASVWQPKPPPNSILPKSALLPRLNAFAQSAYTQKSGEGLSDMLPALLPTITAEKQISERIVQDFEPSVLSIQRHLEQSDLSAALEHIKGPLGHGSGLTPSGDDFIMGMLLTLNRCKEILEFDENMLAFKQQIIETAYEKTTTLSANLIECAAQGLADERLVTTLDYLLTGIGEPKQILDDLLSWGNSSGIAALLGMLVAITIAA